MKSTEEITAAVWRLCTAADYADAQSRTALVEGLHQIAVATLEALAVAEDMAPAEVTTLCRSSQSWPRLITPMNDSEAKRRRDFIRTHLGKNVGFDGTAAQRAGSDAAFALRFYYDLETERRRDLWESLSDHGKAEFAHIAQAAQTPEECHAAFKAKNYPEWERQVQDCEGGEIDPFTGEVSPDMHRMDLRWTYAAGLLGPLTKKNADEWAEAATLYLESVSPEGDLMKCPRVPSVVIDPDGVREANRDSNKDARRAAEDTARKDTRRALKKKLNKGFKGIARKY